MQNGTRTLIQSTSIDLGDIYKNDLHHFKYNLNLSSPKIDLLLSKPILGLDNSIFLLQTLSNTNLVLNIGVNS